jgi:hypothetical protein
MTLTMIQAPRCIGTYRRIGALRASPCPSPVSATTSIAMLTAMAPTTSAAPRGLGREMTIPFTRPA